MFSILRSHLNVPLEEANFLTSSAETFGNFVKDGLLSVQREIEDLQKDLEEARKISDTKDALLATLKIELKAMLEEAARLRKSVNEAHADTSIHISPEMYEKLVIPTVSSDDRDDAFMFEERTGPTPQNNSSPASPRAQKGAGSIVPPGKSLPSAMKGKRVPIVTEVKISGRVARGEILRAAAVGNGDFRYQWYRYVLEFIPIEGAKGAEYEVSVDDLGCLLRVSCVAVIGQRRSAPLDVDLGNVPPDPLFESNTNVLYAKKRAEWPTQFRMWEGSELTPRHLVVKKAGLSIKRPKGIKGPKIEGSFKFSRVELIIPSSDQFALTIDGTRYEFVASTQDDRDFFVYVFRRFCHAALSKKLQPGLF